MLIGFMNSCAWLLHPNIKNQGKGMLEVPWLAVELREWFASSRSTFHWSFLSSKQVLICPDQQPSAPVIQQLIPWSDSWFFLSNRSRDPLYSQMLSFRSVFIYQRLEKRRGKPRAGTDNTCLFMSLTAGAGTRCLAVRPLIPSISCVHPFMIK